MVILFSVGLIVGLFFFALWLFRHRSVINPRETVIGFTGGLGAGKTALAVTYTIKLWKQNKKFCKRHKLDPPEIYSNIPIKVGKYQSINISNDVTLLFKGIPRYSVVLIDEIGSYASQFDYKAPNIERFDEFVRFFRHYVRGSLICTDQCSENIVLVVRRRINMVYNLRCFKKFPIIPFSTVDVRQICISEEVKSIADITEDNPTGFNREWHLGNPFIHYDSFCYSIRYDDLERFEGVRSDGSLKQSELFQLDKWKKD